MASAMASAMRELMASAMASAQQPVQREAMASSMAASAMAPAQLEAAASVAASGLYDPHRMFNGFNGFHSNAESFPGLNDPMQSWAAQHHMVQHSNQMYPTHMNGMSAHQAVVASAAAASASPAGAFFRYMRTAPGTTIHGGFSPGGK